MEQPLHPFAHFAGGFVRKRNCQNGIRRNALFLDQPRNAAGDHAGFARACSSQNEQWAVRGLNGCALFGIQV
jgi:hypothetical protein